jgi:probable HAF family extracellular repeat protein
MNKLFSFKLFIYFILLIITSECVQAVDDLTGLGDLPGGIFGSVATGISADGRVVVGLSFSDNGREAYRWENGVMTGLGDLPGASFYSYASGVNADGSVVVGEGSSLNGIEAFRWTQATGMVGLGDLAGGLFWSEAWGVSADGSVIVGESDSGGTGREAFRWTQATGMVGLSDLAGGGFFSRATGISADGNVVVGISSSAGGGIGEAFRWTQATGMVGLGGFGGGSPFSAANAVSADGNVVVGHGLTINGTEAFRWTQATGMVGLGDLPGGSFWSNAAGVNADGTVVVGYGTSASGFEAFRWTLAGGMQTVVDWLAGAGVTVTGWTLESTNAVNADGSVVVGGGVSANGDEAFIARVGYVPPGTTTPVSGLIGLNSFTGSLASTASTLDVGNFLVSLPFNGAHHRPLLAHPELNSNYCAWASGDLAHYDRNHDADVELAEVGGCYDFVPQQLRLGIGIGMSYVDQDLAFSGESDMDGEYVIAELDYQPATLPVIASLTGLYGRWDADIDRGYLNAGTLDQSYGDTDVDTTSLRVRLDWLNAWTFSGISLTPRVGYTVNHVDVDGYTETGGGFPAIFNSRSHTSHEMRFGVDATTQMTERTRLRGMAEGVHRFDDNGPTLSGQVIGLFSFSLPGADNEDTWARVGAELEHYFGNNILLSASVNGSSDGEDPDVSGGLSLKISF